MSTETFQSIIVLLIGFAVAGSLANGYQLMTNRPLSFRLLGEGQFDARLLAVPVLMFAAPFVIMRNTIRGATMENRRFEWVTLATIIVGFWSLMSGTVVVMAFHRMALLFA